MANKNPGRSDPGSVTVPPTDNTFTLGHRWDFGSTGPAPTVGLPALTERGETLTGSQRAQGLGISDR